MLACSSMSLKRGRSSLRLKNRLNVFLFGRVERNSD